MINLQLDEGNRSLLPFSFPFPFPLCFHWKHLHNKRRKPVKSAETEKTARRIQLYEIWLGARDISFVRPKGWCDHELRHIVARSRLAATTLSPQFVAVPLPVSPVALSACLPVALSAHWRRLMSSKWTPMWWHNTYARLTERGSSQRGVARAAEQPRG